MRADGDYSKGEGKSGEGKKWDGRKGEGGEQNFDILFKKNTTLETFRERRVSGQLGNS